MPEPEADEAIRVTPPPGGWDQTPAVPRRTVRGPQLAGLEAVEQALRNGCAEQAHNWSAGRDLTHGLRNVGHAWRRCASIRNPGLAQNVIEQFAIDVRINQFLECEVDLAPFLFARGGAALGQIAFVDHIGKRIRIFPVGETQQVVQALYRRAMDVRKSSYPHGHCRILDVFVIRVGGALDQPVGILLSDLYQHMSGELIRVVLRPAEQRYVEIIKHSVTHLVRGRE